MSEQEQNIRVKRKLQVGSGSRSEKIRTYNYSQDRITDHRGPITTFNVQSFLSGSELLDSVIQSLITESHLDMLHALMMDYSEKQQRADTAV